MAYSEYLADRLRTRLRNKGLVEERKMMGGLIFMVNSKMCVGIDKEKVTQTDRLMIRVGKLPYAELLGTKGSRAMDFTGRVMRGFLYVSPEGFDSESDLDFWISKAVEFNQLLIQEKNL